MTGNGRSSHFTIVQSTCETRFRDYSVSQIQAPIQVRIGVAIFIGGIERNAYVWTRDRKLTNLHQRQWQSGAQKFQISIDGTFFGSHRSVNKHAFANFKKLSLVLRKTSAGLNSNSKPAKLENGEGEANCMRPSDTVNKSIT
jgi:hypothetical protein